MDYILKTYTPQLILIGILLILPVIFIIFDFWSGTRKAKQNGEFISSYGFRKTISKSCEYYNIVLIMLFIDLLQMSLLHTLNESYGKSFWVIPILTAISVAFIGFTEVKSILEKADEKDRKKMKKNALDILRCLEALNKADLDKIFNIIDRADKKKNEDISVYECKDSSNQ